MFLVDVTLGLPWGDWIRGTIGKLFGGGGNG